MTMMKRKARRRDSVPTQEIEIVIPATATQSGGTEELDSFPVIAFSPDDKADSVASELSDKSYEQMEAHDDTPSSLFASFGMHTSDYGLDDPLDVQSRSGLESCKYRLDQTLDSLNRSRLGLSVSSVASGFQDAICGSLCYSRREEDSSLPFTMRSKLMYKSKVVPEDRTFSTLVSLTVASAYLCFASTEATTVLSTVKEVGVLALCYQAQLPSITPMRTTTSAQPSKRSLARNVLLLIVCVLLWHRTLDATSNLFARSSLFRQPAEKNATSVMFEHQQSASSLQQPDYAVLEDEMHDTWEIEASSSASSRNPSPKKLSLEVSSVHVSRMSVRSRGTSLKVPKIRNRITNVTLAAIKLPLKPFRQTAVAVQWAAPKVREHATNKLSNVWPALKQIWAVALVATVVQVTSEAFWFAATISIRALLNYQEMLELQDWNELSSSMASVPAKGLRRYQDRLGRFSDALVVKKLRRLFSIPTKALLRCRDWLVTRRASFRMRVNHRHLSWAS